MKSQSVKSLSEDVRNSASTNKRIAPGPGVHGCICPGTLCTFLSAAVAADWLQLDGSMETSCLHAAVKSKSTVPTRRRSGRRCSPRARHDGYSDAPGRPVLPDGGTLPRLLAHAEKNSETACSRVTDESVRVPPRVPYRSHTSTNSLWPH